MLFAEADIDAGEGGEVGEQTTGYAGGNMLDEVGRLLHLVSNSRAHSRIVDGVSKGVGAARYTEVGMQAQAHRVTPTHGTLLGKRTVVGIENHVVQFEDGTRTYVEFVESFYQFLWTLLKN